MGTCPCCPQDKTSRTIEQTLKEHKSDEYKVKKLLLLGAGGSGKSTFFKQLRNLHGSGLKENEKNVYKVIIYSNILSGMASLLECFDVLNENKRLAWKNESGKIVKQTEEIKFEEGSFMSEAVHFFQNSRDLDEKQFEAMKSDIAKYLHEVWDQPYIKAAWKQRSQFQIQDSAEMFFNQIDRICGLDYIPKEEDILLARIRTTGIVEQEFTIKKNKFQVYDVGGQRNERKKWIHCFENVTAVLFLASLSAYDQRLYEDDSKNRMEEALDLFKQICNSRWFKETAMILFLNKTDIFAKKIQETPLTVCFGDCPPPIANNEIEARGYIKQKFAALNHPVKGPNGKSKKKPLFCHFTCAIDKNQVERIFRDVQNVIIHANLEKAALI